MSRSQGGVNIMTLFHVHCEMKRGGGNSYRDNLQFILPPAGGKPLAGGVKVHGRY